MNLPVPTGAIRRSHPHQSIGGSAMVSPPASHHSRHVSGTPLMLR